MSNYLAIATVTATLRDLVLRAMHNVPNRSGEVRVRTGRPENPGTGFVGANLYLYRVTPNAAMRNDDQPTRATDGRLIRRPRLALDLSYLITFYGDDEQQEPQRLLGATATMLHTNPVLTRDLIRSTIAAAGPSSYLASSDLAQQPELVKFSPQTLTLEELSKLWTVFFQVTHALSAAYDCAVVLLDADVPIQPALPVRAAAPGLAPVPAPTLKKIEPAVVEYSNDLEVKFAGDNLGSADVRARFDEIEVPAQVNSAGEVVARLPHDVSVGLVHVAVIRPADPATANGPVISSNTLPMIVQPHLIRDPVFARRSDPAGSSALPIIVVTIEPEAGTRPEFTLLLNEHEPRKPPPRLYSLAPILRFPLDLALEPGAEPARVTAAMVSAFALHGKRLSADAITRPAPLAAQWILEDDANRQSYSIRKYGEAMFLYWGLQGEELAGGIAFAASNVMPSTYLVRLALDRVPRAESRLLAGKMIFQARWRRDLTPQPGAVTTAMRLLFQRNGVELSSSASAQSAGANQWTITDRAGSISYLLRIRGSVLTVFDQNGIEAAYIGPLVTVS